MKKCVIFSEDDFAELLVALKGAAHAAGKLPDGYFKNEVERYLERAVACVNKQDE